MKLKILFTVFCFLFFVVSVCNSTTELNFKWEKPTYIDGIGYKIIMDNKSNVIYDIKNPNTITYKYNLQDDKKCHIFSIYSYKGDEQSALGNLISWCPPPTIPPTKFEITIKQIQ